jgi:hypothetical protein
MGKQMSTNYSPRSAWMRAVVYFAVCFAIAHFSGALRLLLGSPLASAENLQDPRWILFTLLCIAVEIWGYVYWWPRGTLTHGRQLYWSVVLTFGLIWGLSEGLLFLSVFTLASKVIASKFLVWLVSFLVIGTFVGLWHQFYWDIHVAPDHNIPEWNAKKVLFTHLPNLMITLAYLAAYESAGIFVLCQVVALIASTYFMRFPSFWSE